MAKLDIDRIISEYYMLKTVLNNKYATDVLSGRIQPAGPSAAADKKTLQAMQRYVKNLGELVIPGNSLAPKETLDAYLDRVIGNFKASELAKPASKRLIYSENPFDDTFKPYITTVLSRENSRAKIETAIRSNSETLNSVNSLVINLGGKKQSSYVKLLSQSTELFSTVSGLQNQIATLERQRKADADLIKSLREQLEAKTLEAQKYKELCEKAIEELNGSVSYTILVGMLTQTSNGLENIIRSEAQKTRNHVTSEADRLADLLTAKDAIKDYMFEHPDRYKRYIMVLRNTKPLNNKGMANLYKEIVDAAEQVGYSEDHPAVTSLFNELREQRLKNDNNLSNTGTQQEKPKKKTAVRVVAVAGVLALLGTAGFLGYQALQYKTENDNLKNEINNITNNFDDTFKGEYMNYQNRENQQVSEYESKLQIAIADGTLVDLPGVTPTPGATNGEVWNQSSLQALREKYAADDFMKLDGSTLVGVDWAGTEEMELRTENAINQIRADFYNNNYDKLVTEVGNLSSQITALQTENAALQAQVDALTAQNGNYVNQIANLNSTIASLQNQVTTLQNQIDSLNAIIDAANQQNSDLANQVAQLTDALNQANQSIQDLQAQVDSLSAENAVLRQQVADLNNQVNDLTNEVNSLNSQITVLETENQTLATEKADLLLQVDALQDQVDSLKDQIAQMQDNDALLQEKAALEQKVAELENQIKDANDRISELESTNEALTNRIVELENSISDLESTIDGLENTIKNLESQNGKLQQQVDEFRGKWEKAVEDYNDLLRQYEDLKSGKAESAEIESLKEQLQDAFNKITGYEQRIVQLYDGITKGSTASSEAETALKELFEMFGINYSESDSPSNNNSEYQPTR